MSQIFGEYLETKIVQIIKSNLFGMFVYLPYLDRPWIVCGPWGGGEEGCVKLTPPSCYLQSLILLYHI